MVEKGLSDNSITAYSADLVQYLDFLEENHIQDLREVDTTVLLAWLIHLTRNGLSSSPGPGI